MDINGLFGLLRGVMPEIPENKNLQRRIALACGTWAVCGIALLAQPYMSAAPLTGDTPALFAEREEAEAANSLDFSKAFLFLTKSASVEDRGSVFSRAPLSRRDAALYREIFEFQRRGDMVSADTKIAELRDKRLMGHVLYQRYTHQDSRKFRFEELKEWMDSYASYPGASKIYDLAVKRKPKNYNGPLNRPEGALTRTKEEGNSHPNIVSVRLENFRRSISGLLRKAQNSKGAKEKRNVSDSYLPEYSDAQGQEAARHLYEGDDEKAYFLAIQAVHKSGKSAPIAAWTAGIAAWKGGRYAESAKFFEIAGQSKYSSAWMKSAGSFWAARAYMKSGQVTKVSAWLDRAAQHPRTFYGLLATRALGRDFDFNWRAPNFTKNYYDMLMATPEGNRAIALAQAGQSIRAESELLRINLRNDEEMRRAVLAYAAYAGFPGLAMKLGDVVSDQDGVFYDAAIYPKAPWEPEEGYKIDPALINAIARQESRFNPAAESAMGAKGLMQIMPGTASDMARDFETSGGNLLNDPGVNLELGQRYIQELLRNPAVKGDILKLAVAYNAGPGNLSRWVKQCATEDPLLFIELLPSSQTRAYVERVLANYWIYRLREGLSTPTLDALAQGKMALYAGDFEDKDGFRLALR